MRPLKPIWRDRARKIIIYDALRLKKGLDGKNPMGPPLFLKIWGFTSLDTFSITKICVFEESHKNIGNHLKMKPNIDKI